LRACSLGRHDCPMGKITLGVCCMASKAKSLPMQSILKRLETTGDFAIEVFPEEVILNEPIEDWPKVECLISFASGGFPLDKAIAYCKLVGPRVINNLEYQKKLCNRVEVYRTLQDWGVPCPNFVCINHLNLDGDQLQENENDIVLNGQKLSKPFVEKPLDGDRHDIWIHYPRSVGGGAKKLFRKEKNQSSEFDAQQNTIRRDGEYIYEPFLPTQGTDIKVYTVGVDYIHAEARKAPTVDGKVQRSKDGKEVRYPVVLTQTEKAMGALIVRAFRQNVCGFDILRTDGGSIVCDVNGWSFVKGNQRYYSDCSHLLRNHLLEEMQVQCKKVVSMPMVLNTTDEDQRETFSEWTASDAIHEQETNQQSEHLRCVLVVMRHGDRRPKEKVKFKSKQPALLGYFDGLEAGTTEVRLNTLDEMQRLKGRMESLAAEVRMKIGKLEAESEDASACTELQTELRNVELLMEVLGMHDRFSVLEQKIQLKAAKWKTKEKAGEITKQVSQVLVVAKWGGELTVKGLEQAEKLGRQLRFGLYPNDPTGLLRLHATFRHDFKIYSSQEGRCAITAAAFTKGFLDLEGDITPILVSLVTRDAFAQGLLDGGADTEEAPGRGEGEDRAVAHE